MGKEGGEGKTGGKEKKRRLGRIEDPNKLNKPRQTPNTPVTDKKRGPTALGRTRWWTMKWVRAVAGGEATSRMSKKEEKFATSVRKKEQERQRPARGALRRLPLRFDLIDV